MTVEQIVDAAQTALLLTVAGAIIYAFTLLRRQLAKSVAECGQLFRSQREMEERIERIWKRIDDIEMRRGLREGDVEQTARLKRLMDALEAASTPTRPGAS